MSDRKILSEVKDIYKHYHRGTVAVAVVSAFLGAVVVAGVFNALG